MPHRPIHTPHPIACPQPFLIAPSGSQIKVKGIVDRMRQFPVFWGISKILGVCGMMRYDVLKVLKIMPNVSP